MKQLLYMTVIFIALASLHLVFQTVFVSAKSKLVGGQGPEAKVYVYSGMYEDMTFYVDNQEIAKIKHPYLLILKLDSGKHTFHIGNKINDKKPETELDLVGGETYYLGGTKGFTNPTRILVRNKNQGERDIINLRPLPLAKIIDASKVVKVDTPENYTAAENWKVSLISFQKSDSLSGIRKPGKNKHFMQVSLGIEYIGIEELVDTPKITIVDNNGKQYEHLGIIGSKDNIESLNDIINFFSHKRATRMKTNKKFGVLEFLFELPDELTAPTLMLVGGTLPIIIPLKKAA